MTVAHEAGHSAAFNELGLPEPLVKRVAELGYESPSPIQLAAIPALLAGHDVLGQAQTGTGKTAAFALPLLAKIDLTLKAPQVLILTPTRELAIQVAEAFSSYGRAFGADQPLVLPVYGGQNYTIQHKALSRGPQVLVATPGRFIDHLERGKIDLSHLQALVLDEADEMLRMGFIDDVTTIIEACPAKRQMAMFSATMPQQIQRLTQTYLDQPKHIKIAATTSNLEQIQQSHVLLQGHHKLDAVTRLLEVETYDATIIFVRTRAATVEVCDKLVARGYRAAALNGDLSQQQREQTIEQLKRGKIDVLVATDVAARGLDVTRLDLVINMDIPIDVEAYTHRVGRTGRAGRTGQAILLVTPREKRLFMAIEKTIGRSIPVRALPTSEDVQSSRLEAFKQDLQKQLEKPTTRALQDQIATLAQDLEISDAELAAGLLAMVQSKRPVLVAAEQVDIELKGGVKAGFEREGRAPRERKERNDRNDRGSSKHAAADIPMETYRVAVGRNHGVKPGDIVGALVNEAELEKSWIGRIELRDDHSFIDLPTGMPPRTHQHLARVRVRHQPLKLQLVNGVAAKPRGTFAKGAAKPKRRTER